MTITGKHLRTALKNADITQDKAAELIGVSRQTVNSWLAKAELSDEIIENVKTKLGLSLQGFKVSTINKAPETVSEEVTYDTSDWTAQELMEVNSDNDKGIPMFNIPGSASSIRMYQDQTDVKIIGRLNLPGAVIGSFALPVYGHSMYPTLANGNWAVLRPISDPNDIEFGEIYYIEYGDYRTFKRLVASDKPDEVTLWSDNQSELVNGRPKYAPKTIKIERIHKLCLLTDIWQKPNY